MDRHIQSEVNWDGMGHIGVLGIGEIAHQLFSHSPELAKAYQLGNKAHTNI